MNPQKFDVSRARLRGPDYFNRYRAPDNGEPLGASGLGPGTEILVVEQGLGVVIDGQARFYATRDIGKGIADDWDGKSLTIEVGAIDRVPFAAWDDGERPLQIFTRWYGFSFNYPGCSVVGGRSKPGPA